MPNISRIGDKTIGTCKIHGPNISGEITTGSSNTFAESSNVAKIGDTVTGSCGHTGIINSGSDDVYCNGNKVARIDDTFDGVYSGTIISGASTVKANG